jgi:hypothetical protein
MSYQQGTVHGHKYLSPSIFYYIFHIKPHFLQTEGIYLVDMTLSACLDADVSVPCYHNVPIFKNYKLPKSLCEWKNGFQVKGMMLQLTTEFNFDTKFNNRLKHN